MNDADIIKALECKAEACCAVCEIKGCIPCEHCVFHCIKHTLDLINRKQAEIDGLTKENESVVDKWFILEKRTKERYAELYEEANGVVRAEAIKEFAKRLKGFFRKSFYCNTRYVMQIIDNLVKEMTEGKE